LVVVEAQHAPVVAWALLVLQAGLVVVVLREIQLVEPEQVPVVKDIMVALVVITGVVLVEVVLEQQVRMVSAITVETAETVSQVLSRVHQLIMVAVVAVAHTLMLVQRVMVV
jgi:hypothetical protein